MIRLTWSQLELRPEQLRRRCDAGLLPFKDTSELEPLACIVGQERAKRAVEFGLETPQQGYHIFLCGVPGTGRTTLAREEAIKRAKTQTVPSDWCYVFNFENPDRPKAISLPAGMGRRFVRDIDGLVSRLSSVLSKAFAQEEFEAARNKLVSRFYEDTNKLYMQVEEFARGYGFTITRNQQGIVSVPLMDGRPITPEEFNALDENEKLKLMQNSQVIQERINQGLREYRELERNFREKLRLLEEETARRAIAPLFAALFDYYRFSEKLVTYLEDMEKDILSNLEIFVEHEEGQSPFVFFHRLDRKHALRRYKVNLIVDNSGLEHAPVVVETNPTYVNLFGTVEYESEFGILATDFTKIRAGSIHRANGGYLIVHFMDLIRNFMAWETMKRVLKNKEISIESMFKSLSLGGTDSLQPEPIPLNLKVIVIGEPLIYYLLRVHDDDFSELFKVKAEFDVEMDRNLENILRYASFIATICKQENLRHFSREAVARVVDYGAWLAEDQRRLTTRFGHLRDIVCEANTWAARRGSPLVEAEDVVTAIREKERRSNLMEEKVLKAIEEGLLMLQVEGKRVGEINGLAVYSIGDYVFGKPCRITAKTFVGEKGVVNIEREVRMSGTIHTKGVLTLSGYLGAKYAQDKPLTLSASLTFEQTYDGVEGDSASSAELFVIISSLAEIPIRQDIAVTGSVNQNGEIQPVGGINQKITGFYRACKVKGLTGTQGVIIPKKNVDNLMLDDEIVEAVAAGMFHIWAIETVDEGIEILMETEAGRLEDNGQYTRNSVHYLVDKKLRSWMETRRFKGGGRIREDYITRRINKRGS